MARTSRDHGQGWAHSEDSKSGIIARGVNVPDCTWKSDTILLVTRVVHYKFLDIVTSMPIAIKKLHVTLWYKMLKRVKTCPQCHDKDFHGLSWCQINMPPGEARS